VANEELEQRKLLDQHGNLKGTRFGNFEEFNIGNTSAKTLIAHGLTATLPATITFPFAYYKAPKTPSSCKPDRVYASRIGGELRAVFIGENKRKAKRETAKDVQSAAEQALYCAKALEAKFAYIQEKNSYKYIDVDASFMAGKLVYLAENRDWTEAVLTGILNGGPTEPQDPKPLAEKIWQIIWHATKSEPKDCLLTFVEIFILKFLSDNLPHATLPTSKAFYELTGDSQEFIKTHGKSQIEYYISEIRPFIKTLFPDNTIANEPGLAEIFGLHTLVSKTSIINGFAFLKSSTDSIVDYNRTFNEILKEFELFGPLVRIDSEFKLRLYETFLKRSARQQKLGQFFTPRNVVRPMIKMARLYAVPDDGVVLDPAAGVGGFILEPMIFENALAGNLTFTKGGTNRRVKTIGVDVDDDLHLLAKANMLVHLVEEVRDPATTLEALNRAMAQNFALLKDNKTLGSLQYPPKQCVDVILTNPPYVTDGSSAYRKALSDYGPLQEYYEGSGLGVESLFMRYISGALKPGGRAFVILPLGFLNRTESRPKEKLLDECNILASIQLPRNTFFNTSQKTYILVIERRHTAADPRPKVICGIARSIGESLDWRRTPEPDKNDLDEIAGIFVKYVECANQKAISALEKSLALSPIVKVADGSDFSKNDRWDVTRFWTDAELVALGERDEIIQKSDFLIEARTKMKDLIDELTVAEAELAQLSTLPTTTVKLSDQTLFSIFPGDRVKTADIQKNTGDIPIYSCFKDASIVKGFADEAWLKSNFIGIQTPGFVTINANGASVGRVFVREDKCCITDDVIAVRPNGFIEGDPSSRWIDLRYLAFRLREVIAAGGYLYEAKLFQARVKELEVALPIKPDGSHDLPAQQKVADVESRIDAIVKKLKDLGQWSDSARLY
jgi:type I restriction enzyme M protein